MIERTSHMGRTKQIKFEENGPLYMESRWQNIFWWEGDVAYFLLIFFIMIQFQIEL
jgi:hypothetical protein